jgi:hypothetical protein
MTPTMLFTLPILNLLAAGDDSGIKLVFGVIVAIIWGIGAIMSALKKKGQQQNQQYVQQDWSHLLRDLTAGQNKPFNPNMPAPPQVAPPQMRPQQAQRPQPAQRQQIKSFAQQSPRPFVQQYPQRQQAPQYSHRPLPPRRQVPAPLKAKPFQGPKPIQRRPKPQRRPPAIPPQTMQVQRPPEAQVGLIQDATVTMGQAGGATSIQTSTTRGGHGPLTRPQLRKLILWSEVLSPPLALRE